MKTKQSSSSTSIFSGSSKNIDANAIVDALWKRMKQEQRGSMIPRSYACGTCGGPHPIERCPATNPLNWCDTCRKMTIHEWINCYYRPRVEPEDRMGQATTSK